MELPLDSSDQKGMQLPTRSSKMFIAHSCHSKRDTEAQAHVQAQEPKGLGMPMPEPPFLQCRGQILPEGKQELQK